MNINTQPDSSSRHRIGVICLTLGQPSETWLWRQIVGLRRHKPTVITWNYKNPTSFPLQGIEWHRVAFPPTPYDDSGRWLHRFRTVPSGNFYGTTGAERRWLIELTGERRLRAFLCHFGWSALRMVPVALATGVPIIAHFHGVDITARLRNRWYRWSLKNSIKHFHALVAVNDFQRDILVGLGAKKDAIHVIPCGVPVREFFPHHSKAKSPVRFLTVGRFVEKKAPLTTLRAFDRCIAAGGRAHLLMIGDGPLLPQAKDFVSAHGLQRHVSFLGALGSTDVLDFMRTSDAFLQHSVTAPNGDMEGWPVSIGEAAACGLAVIATRHAGIPSQIVHGETGYLVEEYDELRMSNFMMALIRDRELRLNMGAAARRFALENFDHEVQIDTLEQVVANSISSKY